FTCKNSTGGRLCFVGTAVWLCNAGKLVEERPGGGERCGRPSVVLAWRSGIHQSRPVRSPTHLLTPPAGSDTPERRKTPPRLGTIWGEREQREASPSHSTLNAGVAAGAPSSVHLKRTMWPANASGHQPGFRPRSPAGGGGVALRLSSFDTASLEKQRREGGREGEGGGGGRGARRTRAKPHPHPQEKMSEPNKYREWILETIDSLRSRKARPDLERICRMVRRRHGTDPERTRAELDKLIQEQTVLKVSYKGSTSYRNAARVQRKSRNRSESADAPPERGSGGGGDTDREGGGHGHDPRAQPPAAGERLQPQEEKASAARDEGLGRPVGVQGSTRSAGARGGSEAAETGADTRSQTSSPPSSSSSSSSSSSPRRRHRQTQTAPLQPELRPSGGGPGSDPGPGPSAHGGRVRAGAERGGLRGPPGGNPSSDRLTKGFALRDQPSGGGKVGDADTSRTDGAVRLRNATVSCCVRGQIRLRSGFPVSRHEHGSRAHSERLCAARELGSSRIPSFYQPLGGSGGVVPTGRRSLGKFGWGVRQKLRRPGPQTAERRLPSPALLENEPMDKADEGEGQEPNEGGEEEEDDDDDGPGGDEGGGASLEATTTRSGRIENIAAEAGIQKASGVEAPLDGKQGSAGARPPMCTLMGDSDHPTWMSGLGVFLVLQAPPARGPPLPQCNGAHVEERAAASDPLHTEAQSPGERDDINPTPSMGYNSRFCFTKKISEWVFERSPVSSLAMGTTHHTWFIASPLGVESKTEVGAPSCMLTPTASPGDSYLSEDRGSNNSSGGLMKCEGVKGSPVDWTVSDVVNYFTEAGFPEQAAAFRIQEIDGKSLLLMQRNDVLTGLSIRLGPALKIYERHVKVLQKTHFEDDDC
ncbi:unnamed protein product, partial [Menidia menidia]